MNKLELNGVEYECEHSREHLQKLFGFVCPTESKNGCGLRNICGDARAVELWNYAGIKEVRKLCEVIL